MHFAAIPEPLGEKKVTEEPYAFFTLVPQADRREQPDRRSFWRGGRRVLDVVSHDVVAAAASNDAPSPWNAAKDELVARTEKLAIH